ncbi:hypothetical protein HG530_009755 [Fusarium avenaceum]|nr:hypothetical protein HG530_009755 [Fusarium avenaceum]
MLYFRPSVASEKSPWSGSGISAELASSSTLADSSASLVGDGFIVGCEPPDKLQKASARSHSGCSTTSRAVRENCASVRQKRGNSLLTVAGRDTESRVPPNSLRYKCGGTGGQFFKGRNVAILIKNVDFSTPVFCSIVEERIFFEALGHGFIRVYEPNSPGVTIDHDESPTDAGQDVSVREVIFLKIHVLWQVLGGVYLL